MLPDALLADLSSHKAHSISIAMMPSKDFYGTCVCNHRRRISLLHPLMPLP